MMKKITVLISGIFVAWLVFYVYAGEYFWCDYLFGDNYGLNCMDFTLGIMATSILSIPLFLFSVITYKMRDEIYESWWKFSWIFMVISVVAIIKAPSHDWMFLVTKGTVAIFLSLVYIITSIAIIAYGYHAAKRK